MTMHMYDAILYISLVQNVVEIVFLVVMYIQIIITFLTSLLSSYDCATYLEISSSYTAITTSWADSRNEQIQPKDYNCKQKYGWFQFGESQMIHEICQTFSPPNFTAIWYDNSKICSQLFTGILIRVHYQWRPTMRMLLWKNCLTNFQSLYYKYWAQYTAVDLVCARILHTYIMCFLFSFLCFDRSFSSSDDDDSSDSLPSDDDDEESDV